MDVANPQLGDRASLAEIQRVDPELPGRRGLYTRVICDYCGGYRWVITKPLGGWHVAHKACHHEQEKKNFKVNWRKP